MTLDVVRTKNVLQLQGFSIFSVENKIFFWGGSGPQTQDSKFSICENKLTMFEKEEFVLCNQKGKIPAPRENHASCVANKGLIIMGGNSGKKFFNDWHFLEFKTMTWIPLEMNQYYPPFLDSLLFWKGGRGFLLTGE